jgi:predicted Zn-ribbon and HTH transcriptional regulator
MSALAELRARCLAAVRHCRVWWLGKSQHADTITALNHRQRSSTDCELTNGVLKVSCPKCGFEMILQLEKITGAGYLGTCPECKTDLRIAPRFAAYLLNT